MGAGAWSNALYGIRERPVIFACAIIVIIFYVSPVYFNSANTKMSFPSLCDNESCQLELFEDLSSVQNMVPHPDYFYLVNTSGCQLMEMDPFDPSIMTFLNDSALPHKCDHRIAKVEGEKLILDRELPGALGLVSMNCCSRALYRVEQTPEEYTKFADWRTRYSNVCIEIPPEGSSDVESAFVKIECSGMSESGQVEKNVEFHGIPLHPARHSEVTQKKAQFWDERKARGEQKSPSILVIGIDSTSRLHMIRKMPKTRKFLLKNDFVELNGYTKIGDNTFPNIMAGFAGMELDNYSSCWPNTSSKLDDCPLIWKDFSKLNYLTGLFEDAPAIAIFNFLKVGFVLPPADYYMRPLEISIFKHFTKTSQEYCAGGENITEFMAKFIRDLMVKMGRDYPYFFFSWFTSISHDDYDGVGTADETFLNLFQTAIDNSSGDPDNTVVIFMSDHGYRYGGIRETFVGFYEESLPFLYFRLPSYLKREYPDWYENLKRSSSQLTTPLDLHETLAQILQVVKSKMGDEIAQSNEDLQQNQNRKLIKQRYSFFERISDERTCQVATIPLRYCMCGVTPETRIDSSLSAQLGEVVVSTINSVLNNNSDICRILTFSKFLYGRKLMSGRFWNKFGQVFNYKEYLVALEAIPGLGHFEAKVRIFQDSSSQILGDVERINSYESQSVCIEDSRLKNYCFCKWRNKRNGKRVRNAGKEIIASHYLVFLTVTIIIKVMSVNNF